MAVAVLCSEVAHELLPTLTFLRDVVRAGVLTGIDRSIAEEEIGRLENLIASLRRTKRRDEPSGPVKLARTVESAAARARDEVTSTATLVVDVAANIVVDASERGLELALTALLRNALGAASSRVSVIASRRGDAWTLAIEDAGPGVPERLRETMYHPLTTLGPDGHGLGVPIVLRVARDHGWDLAHEREGAHTRVTLAFEPPQQSVSKP